MKGFFEGQEDEDFKKLIANTWHPSLAVIGAEGLPASKIAGNVLRPETKLTFCLRLPPSLDSKVALEKLKNILTKDPPFNAQITLQEAGFDDGWNANKMNEWLANELKASSIV